MINVRRSYVFSKVSKVVEGAKSAEEAVEMAGLNWGVEQVPLYTAGTALVDGIPVLGKCAKNVMGIRRTDSNEVIGVTTERYKPIQNAEVFGMMSGLVEQMGATICNLGELKGGSKIFGYAKLGESIVGNDKIIRGMFLWSSHDGSISFNVKMASYRQVCSNGMMVMLPNTASEYKFRHTQNYMGKFEEARQMLGIADAYNKHLEECFQRMIDTPMSDGEIIKYTERLFPAVPDDESKQVQTKRSQIKDLFYDGTGLEDYQNTRWAAYNATTEYVDHVRTVRGGNEENRFLGSIDGVGSKLRQRAFELLVA